jgi:gamma-glutamylcyclotransferase (GGCT)/AIG2-like uncharacterized protein YtfP
MRLFCYGTLQFPSVLNEVTGLWLEALPAVLDDHACFAVRGEVYPGIIPRPGATTNGVVYSGLGTVHLQRLDAFEGDLYERRRVCVSNASGDPLQAWTYVVAPRHRRRLAREPWDREAFETGHLRHFVRRRSG